MDMTTPVCYRYDLDFRPEGYWDPGDPVTAILANVKGDYRRELLRAYLERGWRRGSAGGMLGSANADWLDETAPAWMRKILRRLSATGLDGEDLPDYLPGEVEIARVLHDGAKRVIYSVRARRSRGCFEYRIVDEDHTTWRLSPAISDAPLRLRQLIRLIETATPDGHEGTCLGAMLHRHACGRRAGGARPIGARSEIYPGLGEYYRLQVRRWRAHKRAADCTTGWLPADSPNDKWDQRPACLTEKRLWPFREKLAFIRAVTDADTPEAVRSVVYGLSRWGAECWVAVATHARAFDLELIKTLLTVPACPPKLAANPYLDGPELGHVARWAMEQTELGSQSTRDDDVSASYDQEVYAVLKTLAAAGRLSSYPELLQQLVGRIHGTVRGPVLMLIADAMLAIDVLLACPEMPADVLASFACRLGEVQPSHADVRVRLATHGSANIAVWRALLRHVPTPELMRAISAIPAAARDTEIQGMLREWEDDVPRG